MAALYCQAHCILLYVQMFVFIGYKTGPRLQQKAESLISTSNQTWTRRHIIATMWHMMNVMTLENCYLHKRMRKSLKTATPWLGKPLFLGWVTLHFTLYMFLKGYKCKLFHSQAQYAYGFVHFRLEYA